MEEVDNGFRLPAPLVSIDLFLPIFKALVLTKVLLCTLLVYQAMVAWTSE